MKTNIGKNRVKTYNNFRDFYRNVHKEIVRWPANTVTVAIQYRYKGVFVVIPSASVHTTTNVQYGSSGMAVPKNDDSIEPGTPALKSVKERV